MRVWSDRGRRGLKGCTTTSSGGSLSRPAQGDPLTEGATICASPLLLLDLREVASSMN